MGRKKIDFKSDEDEEHEVGRKYVKLPPFWRNRPDLWFAQVEANFDLAGITKDIIRYNNVIGQLDQDVMEHVSDIISKPPAFDLYPNLKARIIDIFAESEERKLRKLLVEAELGDQRPSQLLRKMKDLAAGRVSDEVLRSLWLQRLPVNVQSVLAVTSEPLDKAAVLADKILDVHCQPVSSISSVGNNSNDLDRLVSSIDALSARIELLERNSRRSRYPSRPQHSRDSSADGDVSTDKKTSDPRLCWWHRKFGDQAKCCKQSCPKYSSKFSKN
ncbi:unnamed protein product [Nesidiocoris tenuis]|uniref:DUF7041 domain-containing protein n=1 Tax=Nesidiocoris tenuis TaxID=355587 RepID=A0A6H5H957_9HEMI|nr:unnamed protein product [Nesidiocoris tenuis]